MTTERVFVIRCNECREEKTWTANVLRHQTEKSVVRNAGFTVENDGVLRGDKHYCPHCNDREKDTFHVYDGHGDEYLGPIEAWGIVDARRVAWDEFDQENVVKRERVDQ